MRENKKQDMGEIDVNPSEMFAVFGPMLKLVEVGLQKGMKPKEVVSYAIDVFREFTKEMNKFEEEN